MCVGSFFVAIVLCICYVFIGRTAIANNVLGMNIAGAQSMTQKELDMLQTMDQKFLKEFKQKPDEDQLKQFIRDNMSGSREYEIDDQISRLSAKYDEYNGMYFY